MRAGIVTALLLAAAPAAAQQPLTCRPGAESNEAKTMASFAVPLAFSGAAAPARSSAGRAQLGFELSYLPNVDPVIATPTICRPDKTHPENTDLLFAAPRPRLTVTLPAGFAVELSWIPPIRLSDVKANLVGVALSRTSALRGRRMLLELRAHGSFGVLHAPITCNDTALQDAGSPCYQGTRSDDAFHPNVFGLAASLGWSLGGGVVWPYLGAGYNHLAPRFQVNFTNRFGSTDRTRVVVDLDRAVLFAGATWHPGRRFALSGELYSAPSDAVTARVLARLQLR